MTAPEETDPSSRRSGRQPGWREDQLIVDIGHLDTVHDLLADLGVTPVQQVENLRLGLAALSFDLGDGEATSIADLAVRLRTASSERWNGWTPTLGKNRVLSQIGGERVIDIGSVGVQRVIDIGTSRPDRVIDIGTSRPDRVIDIGSVGAQRVIDIGGEGTPRPADVSALRTRHEHDGRRSRIAVVDTGVIPQPWLDGAYRCAPESLLSADPGDEPAAHHGTFVTGLVLQVAGGSEVWVEGALGADGDTDSWTLAITLADLAERGVDVVNLSLGCFTDDDQPPLVLQRAVDCFGGQTVVVAAAGNYTAQSPGGEVPPPAPRPCYPAALQNVVAVGSSDADGSTSDFSPVAPWVDVRAAGHDVASTYGGPGDEFRLWSGTSFAAATVSGVIAREASRLRVPTREVWRRIAQGTVKPTELQVGH